MYDKNNTSTGQMFVIGALILAVILISLAFSLNMVIYSENTAARGAAVSEETTLDHYETFDRELERTVQEYTEQEYVDRTNIETSGDSAIKLVIDSEKDRQMHRSGLVNIDTTIHYGILLGQDDFSDNYMSVTDSPDWQLVSGYSTVHKFNQRVNPSNLKSLSLTDLSSDPVSALSVYTVQFTDTAGTTKNVYVYHLTDNSNYRVQVDSNAPCTVDDSASEVNIDYTNGQVNGSDCPSLDFLDNSDWTVSYHNGDKAGGTYGMALTGPESNITVTNFADPTSSPNANPFYQHIISYVEYNTEYNDSKQKGTISGSYIVDLPGDVQ